MSATSTEGPEAVAARNTAMKARIISHMNADHAESISLYLQHYCGVPAAQTSNAKLSDITLDHMIIASRVGRNIVHIDPPLKSFAESRERLVDMNQAALKGLGLSSIKINEYAPPQALWQWGLLFLCLLCYGTFPFPTKIAPGSGSWMYKAWSLGGAVPGLAALSANLGPRILPGMLLIHAAESGLIWWTRLRKHQVTFGSVAWWLWVSNTFISGFASIRRFDELVREKRKQSKH